MVDDSRIAFRGTLQQLLEKVEKGEKSGGGLPAKGAGAVLNASSASSYHRRQARLGLLSPVAYEQRFYAGLLAV